MSSSRTLAAKQARRGTRRTLPEQPPQRTVWVLGWIWWWPYLRPFDRGVKVPVYGPWRCTTIIFEGWRFAGWWFTWYHRTLRAAIRDFRERVFNRQEEPERSSGTTNSLVTTMSTAAVEWTGTSNLETERDPNA